MIQGTEGRLQGFYKSLPWLLNRNMLLKMSNDAISFYHNIVCQNVWCGYACLRSIALRKKVLNGCFNFKIHLLQ